MIQMSEKIVFWCCQNPECRRKNWNYVDEIQRRVVEDGEPLLCRTCGVGHGFVKMESPKSERFLECIIFEGWESRLPLGEPRPDGRVKDANNRLLTRNDFIRVNGIEPYINWNWRVKLGKAKPSRRCPP